MRYQCLSQMFLQTRQAQGHQAAGDAGVCAAGAVRQKTDRCALGCICVRRDAARAADQLGRFRQPLELSTRAQLESGVVQAAGADDPARDRVGS